MADDAAAALALHQREEYALLGATLLATLITGSTLQSVWDRVLLVRRVKRYTFIVAVAAITSLVQTVNNFVNFAYPLTPSFVFYTVINWVFMTHFSVMMVSNRVALLSRNAAKAWRYLLVINLLMVPVSLAVCIIWGNVNAQASLGDVSHSTLKHVSDILEPSQITLWGIIEFLLSGIFVVKLLRKFQYLHSLGRPISFVERVCMTCLGCVGMCDVASVLSYIYLGDLQSTIVKGLVYCIRIRLELFILDKLVVMLKPRKELTIEEIQERCPSVGSRDMTLSMLQEAPNTSSTANTSEENVWASEV